MPLLDERGTFLDEMGTAPPKTNGPPALMEVNGAMGLDGANIGID